MKKLKFCDTCGLDQEEFESSDGCKGCKYRIWEMRASREKCWIPEFMYLRS